MKADRFGKHPHIVMQAFRHHVKMAAGSLLALTDFRSQNCFKTIEARIDVIESGIDLAAEPGIDPAIPRIIDRLRSLTVIGSREARILASSAARHVPSRVMSAMQ